jgi:hypothetical protein
VTEKKIHRSVKLEIQVNDQFHPYVPQHSDQVYQEKEHREQQLDLF